MSSSEVSQLPPTTGAECEEEEEEEEEVRLILKHWEKHFRGELAVRFI